MTRKKTQPAEETEEVDITIPARYLGTSVRPGRTKLRIPGFVGEILVPASAKPGDVIKGNLVRRQPRTTRKSRASGDMHQPSTTKTAAAKKKKQLQQPRLGQEERNSKTAKTSSLTSSGGASKPPIKKLPSRSLNGTKLDKEKRRDRGSRDSTEDLVFDGKAFVLPESSSSS